MLISSIHLFARFWTIVPFPTDARLKSNKHNETVRVGKFRHVFTDKKYGEVS